MCLWPNYVAFKDVSVWGGAAHRLFTIDATLSKEDVCASAIGFLRDSVALPMGLMGAMGGADSVDNGDRSVEIVGHSVTGAKL